MEFIQTLKNEDLVNLNLYILKQNKKIIINTAIITAIALAAGIYACVIHKVLIGIIFFVIMAVAVIGIPLTFKALVKSQIAKNMKKRPNWDVIVRIDDDGLYYAFNTENEKNVDKYVWGDIYYAVDTKGYIYIQISQMTYLIIKKECAEDQNELEQYFKNNLKLNVRYFQKK